MKIEVKFQGHDEPFEFREPDWEDCIELDQEFPELPVSSAEIADDSDDVQTVFENLAKEPQRFKRTIQRIDRLLVMTAIRPRLVEGAIEADTPDEVVPVRSLKSMDRFVIGCALLERSGFNEKATARMRPLSETGGSSRPQTHSESDTGSGPANSLERDSPDSSASRLTSTPATPE